MEPHTVGLFSELLQINEKHIKGAEKELARIKRPRRTTIMVVDKSETEYPDIAWGFNRNTGQWCASIHFEPEIKDL